MFARLSAGLLAAGLLVSSTAAFAWSPFEPGDRYQRGYSGYQRGYEGGYGSYQHGYEGGAPFSRGYGGGSGGGGRGVTSAPGRYSPGTIVIKTGERRLYLMQGNGQAISYAIGVGRIGFTWTGVKRITAKKEWPSWTPPTQMLRRRPDLPRHMVGGINNPLGARALYLGSTLYRIHGSNEPETIGQAVSSGCFRMSNEDVADLYNRVRVGTTVVVQH
jgi:lipoprotein-anchoring transpeptidase ErfK/SrfK